MVRARVCFSWLDASPQVKVDWLIGRCDEIACPALIRCLKLVQKLCCGKVELKDALNQVIILEHEEGKENLALLKNVKELLETRSQDAAEFRDLIKCRTLIPMGFGSRASSLATLLVRSSAPRTLT